MRSRILPVYGCILAFGSAAALAQPSPSGVANAASSSHSAVVAPGSLISIFGTGLASGLSTPSSVVLSTTLGDVDSVMINGQPIPLALVSDSQINAQVPWGAIPGPANVVVSRGGVISQPMQVQVSQFAPALFGLNLGAEQALATNADGSIVGPLSAAPGLASHPATAGDTINLFATGLGPVSPDPIDGAASADTVRTTINSPTLLIGGVPAQISFCGLSGQFVGVYQITAVVPSGVTTGNAVPVQVQTGGLNSIDPVTIALQ
jgi:uncharacterized protein (TIGR03437 family)